MLEAGQWLGIHSWIWIRPDEVPLLAWVTGANAGQLADRLPLRQPRGINPRYAFAGHVFVDAACARGRGARVCPTCLQRDGFASVPWPLRFSFGCARCRTLLLETCPHCRRRITWYRRGIDVCACGRYLRTDPDRIAVSDMNARWLTWIEQRVTAGADAVVQLEPGMARVLSQLSLDGAVRLVEAFGLLDEAGRLTRTGARVTARTMAEIYERGLRRLAQADSDLEAVTRLAPLIHLPLLERLRSTAVAASDARCAALLLELARVRASGSSPCGMSGRYPRGQLSIFE